MITETVLEMHYHRPLMDLFRETFGLGPGGTVNFYKYSPQRECFVGFDQAYARTELSEADFFTLIQGVANGSVGSLGDRFIGYFLQFKVVRPMQKRMRLTPATIVTRPHYRASLDTTKNRNTGLSQHELLYNLGKAHGAFVYYACPMVFDRTDLYDVTVDLDTLRLAELTSCPSAYSDNDSHFIYFASPQAVPVWCSEPVEGRAVSLRELATSLGSHLRVADPAKSAAQLLKVLTDLDAVGLSARSEYFLEFERPSVLSFVADALTIVRLGPDSGEKA